MKEPYGKGLATRPGPESCAGHGNMTGEALTRAHAGQPLSSEITISARRCRTPKQKATLGRAPWQAPAQVPQHNTRSAHFAPEDKQMSRQRIGLEHLADQCRQGVEALAHVDRLHAEKDLHLAGNAQHGWPSSRAHTSASVWRSTPGGTRSVCPLRVTISIIAVAAGGASSKETNRGVHAPGPRRAAPVAPWGHPGAPIPASRHRTAAQTAIGEYRTRGSSARCAGAPPPFVARTAPSPDLPAASACPCQPPSRRVEEKRPEFSRPVKMRFGGRSVRRLKPARSRG